MNSYADIKALADLILNNLAFILIAYFFGLKGLNFRRLTLLGKMLCVVGNGPAARVSGADAVPGAAGDGVDLRGLEGAA